MPRILQIVYVGAAALALVAFGMGLFDYAIAGEPDAHFGSHVFLPVVVLVVIVALYIRRKKDFDVRHSRRRAKRHEKS